MSDVSLWDIERAVHESQRTVKRGQEAAKKMVGFVADNADLRHCNPHDLEKLKRQLRDFNMKTGRWKDG